MFDDWMYVFSISLPLFQAFLCIRFKLFLLILQVRLYFICLLKFSSDLLFPLSLFLLHLTLNLSLIFFNHLFSKILIFLLFIFKIRQFSLPSLFKLQIVFLLGFFIIISFFNLIFQRLFILLF